jgi:hypothetical protein
VAGAEREDERVAAVLARVELLAALAGVGEPAGVVHGDVLAGGGFGAAADALVFDLHVRCPGKRKGERRILLSR